MKVFLLLTILMGLVFIPAQVSSQNVQISRTSPVKMDEFMDMRFGMFIHWGPVSLRGTEIGWSRGQQVATSDYDNLYKEFNPILFDANAWVKAAASAGMKYVTITAKHHDGFCLWPTSYSKYNIVATPYKKDVLKQLAKSCKQYGVKFCVYYSILDWHDPNYPIPADGKPMNSTGNIKEFMLTIKNQLKEIIVNYDPYMLWFDGQWEKPWTDEMGREIYSYIKSLNNQIVINNRLGKEMTATGKGKVVDYSKMIGDYDTPEQHVGKLNMDFPWESCMTMATQWAWKPNDKLKTLKECISTLIKTASANGNLLFNVGPMMDGRIEERQLALLRQMGDWLHIFGESIYETRGGPYYPTNDYMATRKGNNVYIHILDTSLKHISLPAIPGCKVIKATLINGGNCDFKFESELYDINLSYNPLNTLSNVLVLQMDKPTINIPLLDIGFKQFPK